jgi:hypothetical protein
MTHNSIHATCRCRKLAKQLERHYRFPSHTYPSRPLVEFFLRRSVLQPRRQSPPSQWALVPEEMLLARQRQFPQPLVYPYGWLGPRRWRKDHEQEGKHRRACIFRRGPLHNQRRAPRHTASAKNGDGSRSKERTAERPHEFRQAQLVIQKDDLMNSTTNQFPPRSLTSIIPVILRIALSLLLWTLGAAAMDVRTGQTQPKEHRTVILFPLDRAQALELQRWVNAGHDPWCRDPQLVASAALLRISSQFSELERASLSLELENGQKTRVVYIVHSLDGSSTYRITLRRHRFLLPAAGTLRQMIWIPESAEIITRDTLD